MSDLSLSLKRLLAAPAAAGNSPPVSSNLSTSTNEDVSLSGHLPAATDPDGDPVSYGLTELAHHGSAFVNEDGSYNFTPSADFNGSDHFGFTVFDNNGNSSSYTVNIIVNPVSDAPHWLLSPANVSSNTGAVKVLPLPLGPESTSHP